MKPGRLRFAVLLTAIPLYFSLCVAQSAYAELGGGPMTLPDGASSRTRTVQHAALSPGSASPGSSAGMMGGASSAAVSTALTVRETTLASGTTVREYISPQTGTVFGLAWNGPQMPALGSLLGASFPQYVQGVRAVRAAGGGRGPVALEQSGLVVHSGGHMGAFSGQAWLPQALPAGVSGADIQ